MSSGHWEHFYHQADIGIRGVGSTLEEAFQQAAHALMAVVCNPDNVAQNDEVQMECICDDTELLLVDWLNAIIFEMATKKMLFSKFLVSIQDDKLYAKAWGENADPLKHETAVEVKGATYTQLEVRCDDKDKWIAQCVVDV